MSKTTKKERLGIKEYKVEDDGIGYEIMVIGGESETNVVAAFYTDTKGDLTKEEAKKQAKRLVDELNNDEEMRMIKKIKD